MTDKTQRKHKTIDLTEDDVGASTSKKRPRAEIATSDSRVHQLCEEGEKAIMEGVKAVNAMPSGKSRDLYATHSSFIKIMNSHAASLMGIISDVLKMQGVKGNIELRDPEEQLEMIQDFNDNMLERIHSNLDEMAGIKKKIPTELVQKEIQVAPEPRYRLSGAWNEQGKASPIKATLITGTNIARPQVNFKTPIDNSANNPFVPRIRDKPNSVKPLAVLPEYDEAGNIVSYLHPYEFELDRFQPPKNVFEPVTPQEPESLAVTELVFIDRDFQLESLMRDLKAVEQIAIDLEHHSYRTFQGFTCLMQLSTRTKDYIIDTLALRDDLQVLNEVFTDHRKLKVLHGSINDIEWLQRDLGLYIVNMFDTAEAARVLQFSRLSLQFLLKHYCNTDTDKTLQLADWRMRPLPESFVEYARKDTHYLLYIYDRMKNDLLEKGGDNLLQTVYDKSTFLCKQRYQKPVINEETIMNIYRRSRYVFDHRQKYAFREIIYWRDKIAREEDESPGYVLPQHMALDIASKLPREMQGIIACCTPVPSLVRQNLHALHQIMQRARELPAESQKQSVAVEQRADDRHRIQTMYDINNPLVCPHDDVGRLAYATEGSNLPTLLGDLSSGFNRNASVGSPVNACSMKHTPDIGVFGSVKTRPLNAVGKTEPRPLKQATDHAGLREKENLSYEQKKFNTPYERYLETCRLRGLKERKEAEEYRKQFLPPKVEPDVGPIAESTLSNQMTNSDKKNGKCMELSNEEKQLKVPPVAGLTLKQLKHREDAKERATATLTTKQMKRQEEAKLRNAIESGEKLCFNGATVVSPAGSGKSVRKSFPLEIDVCSTSGKLNEDTIDGGSDVKVPHMEPYRDPFKTPKEDDERNKGWNSERKQNRRVKQRDLRTLKREQQRARRALKAGAERQTSNKPVPFDYDNVDFSRFKGGSRPYAPAGKGKRGSGMGFGLVDPTPGGTSEGGSAPPRQLHPNSRLAKGIKKTQKLFNLSSTNMKRK
ncbi:exosome component 10 [Anopheles bellator]|uniref:exosome component 10 n=1 Tax=Anopheles bellator TaxID=139047 RepID=UPI002648B407|nr:exosome component 10 [Anopheles bellator]